MPLYAYRDSSPTIDPTAFVAPGAHLVGDVTVGPQASIWFNAVLRGDSAPVLVGARTNIQDGAVLHGDAGAPCEVGDDCTVGHLAVVHGCKVERGSLIGTGAIVLSRATIGEESLVGAGAVVGEGRAFGPRSLLVGHPARVVRTLTEEDIERLVRPGSRTYIRTAQEYRAIRTLEA